MKLLRLSHVVLASLIIGLSAPAMPAESHHHHEAPVGGLQLNHGKKWETDAPLRQGMAAIQGELAGKLPAIRTGNLSEEAYGALGRAIEAQVGGIVSQCKLEPEADAMLHIVIGQLSQAADVMQGKAKGKPADAAYRAVMTLDSYGKYFNHPGWTAIK